MRSPHRCAEPDSTSISISAIHRSSVRSIDELITVHLIVIGSLARGMCRFVAWKYLRAHLRQNYPARKRSLPFRQWDRFNEAAKQAPPQLRGMVGCCASQARAGTDQQSALRNAAAQHRQGILLPSLNAGRGGGRRTGCAAYQYRQRHAARMAQAKSVGGHYPC
jgi:hypothetical protein